MYLFKENKIQKNLLKINNKRYIYFNLKYIE